MKPYVDLTILAVAVFGWCAILYVFIGFLRAATTYLESKTGPQTIYQIHTAASIEDVKAARWDEGKPVPAPSL